VTVRLVHRLSRGRLWLFAGPLVATVLVVAAAAAAAVVSVRDEAVCGRIKGVSICSQRSRLEVRDVAGERNAVRLVEPGADELGIYDRVAIAAGPGCDELGTGGALCEVPEDLFVLVVAGHGQDLVDGSALTRVSAFEGGAGDDTLVDGPMDGFLYGQGDDDLLHGHAGLDLADGGDGADDIRGGGGPDVIYAGSGPDRVRGGRGRDDIEAGPGRDWIDCGPGVDRLTADRRDRVRRCERVSLRSGAPPRSTHGYRNAPQQVPAEEPSPGPAEHRAALIG
jgi:Ca2+-binding RTX toxin-like protein